MNIQIRAGFTKLPCLSIQKLLVVSQSKTRLGNELNECIFVPTAIKPGSICVQLSTTRQIGWKIKSDRPSLEVIIDR